MSDVHRIFGAENSPFSVKVTWAQRVATEPRAEISTFGRESRMRRWAALSLGESTDFEAFLRVKDAQSSPWIALTLFVSLIVC